MKPTIESTIEDIGKRLDHLEEMLYWLIPATERFEEGDRVEFSEIADRKLISERTKAGVRTGKVVAVKNFYTVTVLLDGYKRPKSFHHMFFNPLRTPRLRARKQ